MIVRLGLQIEDERRNAKEPAAEKEPAARKGKGGQKPKRPTNRERARARKEGARGETTA